MVLKRTQSNADDDNPAVLTCGTGGSEFTRR